MTKKHKFFCHAACYRASTVITDKSPGPMSIYFLTIPLGVVSAIYTSVAPAFSVNGVESGMSADEAVHALKAHGDRVNPSGNNNGAIQSYIGIGAGGLSESVSLCNGLLVRYNYEIKGDFHTFTRMVQRESEKVGAPVPRVHSDETPLGDLSAAEFYWAARGETKEISYTVVGSQSAQIDISLAILPNDCKK
jgi:hypothetical protein